MEDMVIEQNPHRLKQFSQRWLMVVSGLALVSLILIYSAFRSDTYKHTPALDQMMEMKTQILESHLLYEEMRSPMLEEGSQFRIREKVEQTHLMVENSIQGKAHLGEMQGTVPGDQILLLKLNQLHDSLHSLMDLLKQENFELGHDELFNVAFEIAISADARMHDLIESKMVQQQHYFSVFLVAWLLVVLFLVWRWRVASASYLLASDKLHRLSHAVEQMGESLLISNREGVIEYVNPAFTKITGYEPSDVFGKNPSLLSSGQQSTVFYEQMWKDILGGKVWRGEVVDKRKDGSLYRAEMSISPILNKGEEVTHFVAIQRDITELRETQDNLTQAKKMDAIGTMCCGLAHDMNNTLAVLIGNLEMAIMDEQLSDETRGLIDQAETAGLFAATMMKELLVFSRRDDVSLEIMDLNDVVQETLMLMQIAYQNVKFEYAPTRDHNFILGDHKKLHRVLVNIIRNACDAMEETVFPMICLSIVHVKSDEVFNVGPEDKDMHGDWVCLSISDNGCGIPEHLLEKVFDPFFTTKEVGKGTGLGLSSVYGLVQSHQGFVDVQSKVGQGTTFSLYFPAKQ